MIGSKIQAERICTILDDYVERTTHLPLILIQSLIFFFQVTVCIPWNSNPFAGRGEVFAMLIGLAVFLAAILLGDLAGYLCRKHLRDKVLYIK